MIPSQYLLAATCVALSAVLFGIQTIFGAKLHSFKVDSLALYAIRYAVTACLLLLLFGRFRKSL
jgi:drug/metabolite transporter (DMT)-like permease